MYITESKNNSHSNRNSFASENQAGKSLPAVPVLLKREVEDEYSPEVKSPSVLQHNANSRLPVQGRFVVQMQDKEEKKEPLQLKPFQLKESGTVQRVIDNGEWGTLVNEISADREACLQIKVTQALAAKTQAAIVIELRDMTDQPKREAVKAAWAKIKSDRGAASPPNPLATDVHDLVRENLGIQVNEPTSLEMRALKAEDHTDDGATKAMELREAILSAAGVAIGRPEIKESNKAILRRWMLANAAIGVVLGAGICNDFGALSALLSHMIGLPNVQYVGDDAHNYSSYEEGGKRLAIDPWKSKDHKKDDVTARKPETIYSLTGEDPEELWNHFEEMYLHLRGIAQGILAAKKVYYAAYLREPNFAARRIWPA